MREPDATDPGESPSLAGTRPDPHPGVLARYAAYLPITNRTPMLSLGEGDTPLVRSMKLEREIGAGALYFKMEGANPTGSFKDRGMVLTMAKAVEEGSRAVICASTGNTSAAAAAYAARAGLQAIVIVPDGYVALGKLAQAMIYGARVVMVRGNFDHALALVRKLSEAHPVTIVNSINRYRIEGQKTAAFEICDRLGDAPDFLAIPVGNAGNITAYWAGFCQYASAKRATKRPRMLGFEAAGAAPIVRNQVIPNPETVATAIRIGNPASWELAVEARDSSGGMIACVTDEEILDAYGSLAQREGLFVEPASAASVAGLRSLVRSGQIDVAGRTVVCVLTGNGLKDPDRAVQLSGDAARVDPDLASVERALGWA
ncbi:MAG TPA: threonine synthase [Chloroflexota bacterium]|nr:threonine synthase [Chloroflexota bacterium]